MAHHSTPSHDDTRIAVLIDCDNVSPTHAGAVLEELASYGTPTIKRAYGDWTTSQLNGWKKELNRWAIQPVQQFAYTVGKNSTDSALIIDAMDLMWMGNVESFAIVSSDSDFTRLATRLRESGKKVIGLGRRKTPISLRNAVDQFIYLELLGSEDDEAAEVANEETVTEAVDRDRSRQASGGRSSDSKAASKGASSGRGRKSESADSSRGRRESTNEKTAERTADGEPAAPVGDDRESSSSQPVVTQVLFSDAEDTGSSRINLQSALTKAINATSDDSGWATLSLLGQHLNRTHADFDARDFGYRKLSDLVAEQSYLDHRTDGRHMQVRLKQRSGGRRS
ncbi:MAG: NYN domain-containing protein [Brevibacterium yomogidense]|uniref:NYN domain-containing protein n=1 Tax=Brevibacterium sp. Mu109 TaxID=1255669 RepID=UPI000C6527BA|nr:NYN domain-containing protein [Brevibacterium sp. Mu109]SMX90025.1 TIGR00288 family protein [Brevibacterium sp. Mu109]